MDMSLSKPQELVMDREAWNAAVHEVTKTWTQLSNWTELNYFATNMIIKDQDLPQDCDMSLFFHKHIQISALWEKNKY